MMKSMDHSRLIVEPGGTVKLADFDPGFTGDYKDTRAAKEKLKSDIRELSALQEVFCAQEHFAMLIVIQGINASGKDGVIKHVMSGVNPQGVDVTSFKTPSTKALAHDYLWRCVRALPNRGRFGIFNRSYYEEVIVVRVHSSLLEHEGVPHLTPHSEIWQERFDDIRVFERHLIRNGTIVLKFFLNLSKQEQVRRLLQRIDMPEKNWKISAADVRERTFWNSYQSAYEEMLTHTGTAAAPWHIIPADHAWFTRAVVADIIIAKLSSLELSFPLLGDKQKAVLATERKLLIQSEDAEPAGQVSIATTR